MPVMNASLVLLYEHLTRIHKRAAGGRSCGCLAPRARRPGHSGPRHADPGIPTPASRPRHAGPGTPAAGTRAPGIPAPARRPGHSGPGTPARALRTRGHPPGGPGFPCY